MLINFKHSSIIFIAGSGRKEVLTVVFGSVDKMCIPKTFEHCICW